MSSFLVKVLPASVYETVLQVKMMLRVQSGTFVLCSQAQAYSLGAQPALSHQLLRLLKMLPMTAEKRTRFFFFFSSYIFDLHQFAYSFLLVIVQALRDSPAYDSFLRRWKLSVYFSLRFQVQPSATLSCSGMISQITLVYVYHSWYPFDRWDKAK